MFADPGVEAEGALLVVLADTGMGTGGASNVFCGFTVILADPLTGIAVTGASGAADGRTMDGSSNAVGPEYRGTWVFELNGGVEFPHANPAEENGGLLGGRYPGCCCDCWACRRMMLFRFAVSS